MRLFRKQAQPVNTETSYQDVVDYLTALDQTDYNKILKVVTIYREADKNVKKVLNIKEVPAHINHEKPNSFLDDDTDTELGNFLDDEPPKKPKAKKVSKK